MPKEPSKETKATVYRNAKTGRFVSKSYQKRKPTYVRKEAVHKKPEKPRKKK